MIHAARCTLAVVFGAATVAALPFALLTLIACAALTACFWRTSR